MKLDGLDCAGLDLNKATNIQSTIVAAKFFRSCLDMLLRCASVAKRM